MNRQPAVNKMDGAHFPNRFELLEFPAITAGMLSYLLFIY